MIAQAISGKVADFIGILPKTLAQDLTQVLGSLDPRGELKSPPLDPTAVARGRRLVSPTGGRIARGLFDPQAVGRARAKIHGHIDPTVVGALLVHLVGQGNEDLAAQVAGYITRAAYEGSAVRNSQGQFIDRKGG